MGPGAPELRLAVLEIERLDGTRRVAHLQDVILSRLVSVRSQLLHLLEEAAEGRRGAPSQRGVSAAADARARRCPGEGL